MNIGDLPQYKAPDDLWANIERQIQQANVKPAHAYWAIAASFLILFSLGFLMPGEENETRDNVIITLEKELKGAPVLSPAIRSTYETQFVALEKELANCLMGLGQDEIRTIRPKLAEYYGLASRQDELLNDLKPNAKNQQWQQTLILVEHKRNKVLYEIFGSVCPQHLQPQKPNEKR
ncbi:MAG: hypothetical protein AAFY71_16495 [Bacteroidota bacterium]